MTHLVTSGNQKFTLRTSQSAPCSLANQRNFIWVLSLLARRNKFGALKIEINSNQIKCSFLTGGETRSGRGKTAQSRVENLTNSTYMWRQVSESIESLSSTTRRQRQLHKFCIFNEAKKSFARPSSAFFISVHFFPVLGKSATWNDHFSGFTENVNTRPPIWIFFPGVYTTPLNSVPG